MASVAQQWVVKTVALILFRLLLVRLVLVRRNAQYKTLGCRPAVLRFGRFRDLNRSKRMLESLACRGFVMGAQSLLVSGWRPRAPWQLTANDRFRSSGAPRVWTVSSASAALQFW